MDSSRNPRRYDVFLSFRGTDTRNTFTDHLYHHLIRKGIFVFKDDRSLHEGDFISPQLLHAIQDSRVSIVIFSNDYASSSWCLEEMTAIADSRKQLKLTVIPVFYDVDPSHVRKQIGVFRDAFFSHTRKRFKHDPTKVKQWQIAMTELANLAGFDVRDKPEFAEIEKIVQAVIKTLGHKFSRFTNDLIGIQPRVEELEKLLKLSSEDDDFQVLGIWGMGGVGKTTHATVLYDRISYQFDARCFIDNISKKYRDGGGGGVAIQKQILRQTLDEKKLDTYDSSEISEIIRNRLHSSIKVLLVLDNVDQLEQLQELDINPRLLCKGSRIIITSRDEHILKVYGADKVHKVPLLNSKDAYELFCRKAFKSEDQSSSCVEFIPEVLGYAQHHPLAIRVVGSFLCTRDAIQWRDALDRLRKNPDSKIMDVLQMSIDGLQHEEKEIFLHIACFFKGEREEYVKRILDACGLYPHIGIQRILEKSLITIRSQEIHMHEMLQELGMKIVRHCFPEEPALWSRLWLYKDFYQVLMTETGTNNVKAIVQKENFPSCRADGFSNMRNLRLLILYHNSYTGNLSFLSNNLKFLLWHGYPFTSLPSNFEPYYLVELNMPDSRIEQLWGGRKNLPYLKRMDLSNSKYLIETPEFFLTPNLERLDFTGCTNLIQVHPSIGHLTELAFLSLQNCSSLFSLDFGSVSNLGSLRVLRLSGCTDLEKTPDFTGASNLEYLDMDGCESLSTVHEAVGALEKLRFLSLRDCTNLVGIPQKINSMKSLLTLDLCGCLKLATLPLRRTIDSSCLDNLIFLDVRFCNLLEVPDAIGELRCLERLNLQGNKFHSLPSTIGTLRRLAYLNLAHCHELESITEFFLEASSSEGGRYFKTASGSRDHRSGLYIFDCPKMKFPLFDPQQCFGKNICLWLHRLVKVPCNFRCGLDFIVPWDIEKIDDSSSSLVPKWFNHQFEGGSIIRTVQCDVDDNCTGFAFCVAFEANKHLANYGSQHDSFSPALPHPFYLSFESEHTEERFDMPLSLELDKIDGSKHLWIIYISREHCHFLKTGAHITFKACSGLMIKAWGMRMVIKKAEEYKPCMPEKDKRHVLEKDYGFIDKYFEGFDAHHYIFDYVEESSNSSRLKIQLPYNWLVTKEEEFETFGAKSKEIDLSNLGL